MTAPAWEEVPGGVMVARDLEGLPSQIERLDYLLSEGDSGTLASLDPTLLLMGVRRDELEGPVQTGHKTALVLEGENVSARYLELSGTSVDAGTKQADAAKGSILEQAQCVLVDPADLGTSVDAGTMKGALLWSPAWELRLAGGRFRLRAVDLEEGLATWSVEELADLGPRFLARGEASSVDAAQTAAVVDLLTAIQRRSAELDALCGELVRVTRPGGAGRTG